MIIRELTMTVSNTSAKLNEPLQIYRNDRGIDLKIKVIEYKFKFDKEVESDVIVDNSIISARAVILKPNGHVFECPKQPIEDDCVVIHIDKTWTDERFEEGKYQLQLQLYGSDYVNERVTLPPVSFTVAPVIGHVAEEGVSYDEVGDGMAGITGAVDGDGSDANINDFENNMYNKTEWKTGDLLTASRLNKMEDALEYIIENETIGLYFKPSVNESGDISWSNNRNQENPETVNIRGPQGIQGEKGDPLTYEDLTEENKANLTQGFLTCGDGITRIEIVTSYPVVEEPGVLYIKVRD